jgi:tetratricopeptide (TPR) repeat protein
VAALGAVQAASDGLEARAAAPYKLPHLISPSYGRRVYETLDRVAPAPFVETTLADEALQRGDYEQAERYALKLPPSTVRDALLARIAAARGRAQLALEYEVAAYDAGAVEATAEHLAPHDPAAAYRLEAVLERRLSGRATHPDAVAEAHWQMGLLANRTAWREVPGSVTQRHWLLVALSEFDAAAQVAPLSVRYSIADANQADLLAQRDRAQRLFARAAAIDPGSADALAGLGVIALESGDRNGATAYLARARARDPHSLMVEALARRLR